MSRPVSRSTVISAIIRKDLAEYGRDKLWAFLTVFVIVAVIALFWVLPDQVEESISVGLSGLDDPVVVSGIAAVGDEGLSIVAFATGGELESVIRDESRAWQNSDGSVSVGDDLPEGADEVNVPVGIAFPADFFTSTAAGERTEVTVFVDAAVPEEIRTAVSGLVRELAFAVAGDQPPVDLTDPATAFVVLGTDRVGNQVSVQDGFRPIFVFLILLMEMFVMASLIAKEIQDKTVTAVLVTPATIGDVLAAKGIAGALSGLAQAVIVLIGINALTTQPVLVLTLMLVGAVMVSGTAMIVGSTGKDFMSTLFYGMVFMIPLMIPAFAALFPGTASLWIRVLPSYPLVEALVEVSTYGAGWSDIVGQLGALLAWCVALFALGWFVLKRKVQSL